MNLVATSTFAYDALNRLTDLDHKRNTTTLAGYDLAYDAASRITSINSFVDGLSTFSYDVTNQVTAADHTGQADDAYGYDLNGNRNMSGHSVGSDNRLLSDGVYNYTYDDEGNRATKTHIATGEKEEYTWDHRNRLTKVTFKNAAGTVIKTVEHAYDVFNRWTRRLIDPDGATGSAALVDAIFASDGLQQLFEFDGPNASDLTDRNLWGPAVDQILASEDVTSLTTAGIINWPFTDHLGTPRDIARHSAGATTVVNHQKFDTYGKLLSQSDPTKTIRQGYTGRPYDEATNLGNHLHRWYAFGLWLNQDPIGFAAGDANLARYSQNAPTMRVDPDGLDDALVIYGVPHEQLPVVYAAVQRAFDAQAALAKAEEEYDRAAFWEALWLIVTEERSGYDRQMQGHEKDRACAQRAFSEALTELKKAFPEGAGITYSYVNAGHIIRHDVPGTRPGYVLQGFAMAGTSGGSVEPTGDEQYLLLGSQLAVRVIARTAATKAAGRALPTSGNSYSYVGETHVYVIRGPKGPYKVGQSMQGVRAADGASIRAEAQVRELQRQTGSAFSSEIRRVFPGKKTACKYETKYIETFRRLFGQDKLPGNKTNR